MTGHIAGARASVPGLPQPGATVGSYVIERLAGSGGMSVVYEARHSGLEKRVALKMLLPHYAAESDTARRFAREGAAAARLNHAHAVDVTDVGRDETGAPFLVMEYLDGEDLGALLARAGKLGVEQAADLLVPVIAALAAAHDLGIVHRDLKPQNIMLAQRRHELVPKVVDFGISKVLEESMQLTGTQALLGTPKYMSPEQASAAGKVDARSDQFAVGAVLYECLCGVSPFEAPSIFAVIAQVVEGKYKKPRELVPTLPRALEAVIVRALRKDPSARFASMRELGAAILPFASMRVQLSYATELDPKAPAPVRRSLEPQAAADAARKEPITNSAVVAIAHTMTVAKTWLGASAPRRAWGIAALSALVAVLGVALPVALIAMRDHESAAARVPAPAQVPSPGDESGNAEPAGKVDERKNAAIVPLPQVPTPAPTPPKADPAAQNHGADAPSATHATLQIDTTVDPVAAWIWLDGATLASKGGRVRHEVPVDGTEHELRVGATGHKMRTFRFKDTAPPAAIALEKLPAKKEPPKPAPSAGTRGALIIR